METLVSDLRLLWADVLGVESVDDGDNFFAIGGDSMLMYILLNKLRVQTGLRFEPHDLFNNSQFREFSALAVRVRSEANHAEPPGSV